jgi:hypothetical protein
MTIIYVYQFDNKNSTHVIFIYRLLHILSLGFDTFLFLINYERKENNNFSNYTLQIKHVNLYMFTIKIKRYGPAFINIKTIRKRIAKQQTIYDQSFCACLENDRERRSLK